MGALNFGAANKHNARDLLPSNSNIEGANSWALSCNMWKAEMFLQSYGGVLSCLMDGLGAVIQLHGGRQSIEYELTHGERAKAGPTTSQWIMDP